MFNLLVGGYSDALYLDEFVDVAERAVLVTVVDDVLGSGRANSGQGLKQPGGSPIDVDFLGALVFSGLGYVEPELAQVGTAGQAAGRLDEGL